MNKNKTSFKDCLYRIDGLTGNGIGGVIRVNECTLTTTGHRNCNCLCIINNGDCPFNYIGKSN